MSFNEAIVTTAIEYLLSPGKERDLGNPSRIYHREDWKGATGVAVEWLSDSDHPLRNGIAFSGDTQRADAAETARRLRAL